MDKKFFVPYQTARQLKEKGYPQELAVWYYYKMVDEFVFVHSRYVPGRVVKGQLTELGVLYTAAPTYHEVLDWLEGKGICVSVILNKSRGGWFASIDEKNKPLRTGFETYDFPTREEALNAAILKALEML